MDTHFYRRGIVTLLTLLIGLTLIGSGCSSKRERKTPTGPITSNTIVASIDDTDITLGEVLSKYETLTAPGLNVSATPENALNEILYLKAAYLATEEYRDYDKHEIHRLAINRTHDVLMRYMFLKVISNKAVVSEASIDSFYNANLFQYSVPERRSVTHLLISTNPKAWEAAGVNVAGLKDKELDAKAKEECTRLYQLAKSGTDIGDLAAKHSHDTASKTKHGDSGLIRRGEMVQEFDKVAFKLPKGVISPPFKTIYGWHILRVDQILDSTVEPLDTLLHAQIKQQLRLALENKLGQEFVDSCSKVADFTWNEPLLQNSKSQINADDWAAIINGTDTIYANLLGDAEAIYRSRAHKGPLDIEARKDIIRGQASPFILNAAARKLGFTEMDTIKSVYFAAVRDELVTRISRERYGTDLVPKEDEMKSYYDAHIDDFQSKKPLKVQHIVFQDSAAAASVLDQLRKGADFKEMAMKNYPGEQDFKEAAFDLGWISQDDVAPEFYNAAWIVDKGGYTGPVRTKYGFHIIKVIDHKTILDFNAAKNQIADQIRHERSVKANDEWIKKILKGHDIVKYDEILKQVDFSKPEQYTARADSLLKASSDTSKSGS